MSFAKDMIRVQEELKKLGHEASAPYDAKVHTDDEGLIDDLDTNYEYCVKNDVIRKSFEQLAAGDAVLVLNHPKNGIDGYIGTSTLMELGLSHYLRKKIFIMYDIPSHHDHRWVHEVRIMQPTILNGNLTKVV